MCWVQDDASALLSERLTRPKARGPGQAAAITPSTASAGPRIATIGAYRMPGVDANAQLIQFDMAGIAVSAGSACSSGSLKTSHVLAAMGWDETATREVVRVSFAPTTTEAEIDRFVEVWTQIAEKRRAA